MRGRQGKVLAVLAVLLVIATGSGYAYYHSQVNQAFRSGQEATAVDIPQGASVSKIGELLAAKGVIGSALVFEVYVRAHGLSSKLQAGHYSIPGGRTMVEVVLQLEHSRALGVTVTIPEGLTTKQVADRLEKKGLFAAADYLGALKPAEFQAFDFLSGRSAAAGLDGYLFPDTYEFSAKATPKDVITTQLQRFGEQVPAQMRAKAGAHNLTFDQALVLASIVEREARFAEDRPVIASVFYNRLESGIPLQSDITVLYAKGLVTGDISEDDKKLDSPYNTYVHTGLPPGAICNPGLSAIKAALEPANTSYLYFLADKQGHVHFSKTLAEHQQLQVQYGIH